MSAISSISSASAYQFQTSSVSSSEAVSTTTQSSTAGGNIASLFGSTEQGNSGGVEELLKLALAMMIMNAITGEQQDSSSGNGASGVEAALGLFAMMNLNQGSTTATVTSLSSYQMNSSYAVAPNAQAAQSAYSEATSSAPAVNAVA
jgi:hypothetical protein